MFKVVTRKESMRRHCFNFLLAVSIVLMIGSWTMSYGQATLDVQAKNVTDNGPAAEVTFGTILAEHGDFAPASQYIEIGYSGDTALWTIDIYTDNRTAETGYQRGGLLSTSTTTARIPLLWSVYDNIQAGVSCSTVTWHWIKDKGDENIPPEPGQEDKYDESWDNAAGSYAQVVYGKDDWSNLPKVPTEVPNAKSPIFVYLSADLRGAAAGDYNTTICFDLYHLAPAPSHTPIKNIGIIGDKIVFNATMSNVTSTMLHYKIEGSTGSVTGLPVGKADTYTYTLSRDKVTKPGNVYYHIEATNGERTIWWPGPGEEQWQEVVVSQSITEMVWFKGGSVVLPDGNPDDGEVMVDIPEGALTDTTKIMIEQITDLSKVPGYSELEDWQPVAIYNLTEEGIRFKKAVTMNLLYFDLDNNGKPEDWAGKEMEFNESQLACYWWDGITWRPVGGKVDSDRNIVSVRVSHFSYYGLFKVRPMGISEYRPKERIITPVCADGKNDVAYFSGLTGQVATIRIYDITGKKIRTIEGEPYEWDGTDDDRNIVESGIYIYQFKADVDGKRRLVSGTIVVAK